MRDEQLLAYLKGSCSGRINRQIGVFLHEPEQGFGVLCHDVTSL